MKRALGSVALLLVAASLAACTAGAPSTGPRPTPTAAAQLAAVRTTDASVGAPTALAAPTATSPAPTATIESPTAAATASAPAPTEVAGATTSAGGKVAFAAQDARPAPPPDPGTGFSEIIPAADTLEHPIFGDDPAEKQVALTFDAGADRGYAPEILDLLADYGLKASFGMTGKWAEDHPDLVRRMVDEGHMLFNHTYDHDSLTGANTGNPPQTAEEVAWQLETTETIVKDLTGYEMRPYFRPPYGDYDEASLGYLADNGYYITVWWTCDSQGWRGWDPAKIAGYCTTNIKNHEILLLHVGAGASDGGSNGDYDSLPAMIEFFGNEGYDFVTIEEMLQP